MYKSFSYQIFQAAASYDPIICICEPNISRPNALLTREARKGIGRGGGTPLQRSKGVRSVLPLYFFFKKNAKVRLLRAKLFQELQLIVFFFASIKILMTSSKLILKTLWTCIRAIVNFVFTQVIDYMLRQLHFYRNATPLSDEKAYSGSIETISLKDTTLLSYGF